MSQSVLDTIKTLRDVQAYARQLKDKLSDAHEYIQMIYIPEGAQPTADDMMLLELVFESIGSAVQYSGTTSQ